MFNIYLGIYIIVSLALIAGGTKKLYDIKQSVGAIIFLIGAVAICIIYGLRWFGANNSLFSKTPVAWPPTINTCPDYLTFYKRAKADGTVQDTCIDLIGVSTNGALKSFPPNSNTIPSGDEFYFNVNTTSTDAAAKKNELCQRAITAGLTWEGITNGEGCVSSEGIVAPGASGTAACPK
jgi:hypothetical protein